MAHIAKRLTGSKMACYDELRAMMDCMVVRGGMQHGAMCMVAAGMREWLHPAGLGQRPVYCFLGDPPRAAPVVPSKHCGALPLLTRRTPPLLSRSPQKNGLGDADVKCARYHASAVLCMQQSQLKGSNTKAELNLLIQVCECG